MMGEPSLIDRIKRWIAELLITVMGIDPVMKEIWKEIDAIWAALELINPTYSGGKDEETD